jgi:hypothetical protein
MNLKKVLLNKLDIFKIKRRSSKKQINEQDLFPCKNCIVRASCNRMCDKLEMNDDKIKTIFKNHQCCPDCGSTKFFEGPSGGGSQNIQCAGCGHRFNLAFPFFVQRISISPDGRFNK